MRDEPRVMKVPSVPGVELSPIPGIVGYAAGSDGHIYSFLRRRGGNGAGPRYTTSPQRLNGWANKRDGGRLRVNLCWRGKRDHSVHRLVASAFHGPCPPGLECSHLNGDATDNRPSNLTWESHAENLSRMKEHGTTTRGERSASAKLTRDQVLEIRHRRNIFGEKLVVLAKEFGVCEQNISQIARGDTWKEVAI